MKMQRFIKDTSGSAMAITGLALAMLLASAAIGVDMGYAYLVKTRLQGTADLAAMSGAAALPDEANIKAIAQAYAALNMPSASNGEVLSEDDVTLGNWDAVNRVFTPDTPPLNAVRVVTQRSDGNGNPLNLFFGRVLGIVDVNLSRMAIARRGPKACVIALKPDDVGVFVNSDGGIITQDCGIHANSTDYNSIRTNSGSDITVNGVAEICTAGDYEGDGYTPTPTIDCEIKPDPLASQMPPPIGTCDHTDKVVVQNGDTDTLSPGRYCKGIEINSGGTANFEPGIFIIEGDKFIVNSDSTAQGTGVGFYLRDKDALVLFNSDSHVDFSAPVSGPMAGVLLYVDRDIGELTHHEINSDSTSRLNGAVYMPESELLINSIGQMGGPGTCTNYVVGNLVVNSNSSLYVDQDYVACGVPLPSGLVNSVQLVR